MSVRNEKCAKEWHITNLLSTLHSSLISWSPMVTSWSCSGDKTAGGGIFRVSSLGLAENKTIASIKLQVVLTDTTAAINNRSQLLKIINMLHLLTKHLLKAIGYTYWYYSCLHQLLQLLTTKSSWLQHLTSKNGLQIFSSTATMKGRL